MLGDCCYEFLSGGIDAAELREMAEWYASAFDIYGRETQALVKQIDQGPAGTDMLHELARAIHAYYDITEEEESPRLVSARQHMDDLVSQVP